MYHTLSVAMIRKTTVTRVKKNGGSSQMRFSGISDGVFDHQNTWCRPTKMMSSSSTTATGMNATYPSRNLTTGLDQRAVVIRCTATNITPADEIEVK